jgi:hypothetical protein
VDYVCLRYPLPPVCADLADEVDAYTIKDLPKHMNEVERRTMEEIKTRRRIDQVRPCAHTIGLHIYPHSMCTYVRMKALKQGPMAETIHRASALAKKRRGPH